MIIKKDQLKESIAQKNLLLEALKHAPSINYMEVNKVKKELDGLLYLYFKSLKSNGTDIFISSLAIQAFK